MDPRTVDALIALNRRFYEDFGAPFAATRRRVQDGVRRVLAALPDDPADRWLDLGCGSGALAAEWLAAGRRSAYHGLDFSHALLDAARALVSESDAIDRAGAEERAGAIDRAGAEDRAGAVGRAGAVTFVQADLAAPGWAEGLAAGWAGAFSFAVLHHLPSHALRVEVLRRLRGLLGQGAAGWRARFYLSVWQFQHSPRLLARVIPWERAGLRAEDLEPGDTLLDWRSEVASGATGYRYVHRFDESALADLAAETGFRVRHTFESDGHGGRLGLYQEWECDDESTDF